LRTGHGLVDLSRATTLSCNAYYRRLAADTPEATIRATLVDEGFVVTGPLSAEAAVGLESRVVSIAPARLLEAYRRLTREPWPAGEPVRRLVLSGLRDAALFGTANGLDRRGYWAKTGTASAVDRRPLATSGWALAIDDSGWGILGFLRHGTGRETARLLATTLARLRPWAAAVGRSKPDEDAPAHPERVPRATTPGIPNPVRVLLFEALHPARVSARNRGVSPVSTSRGYLGAGASVELEAGDQLGAAPWELTLPERHMVREIEGSLSCDGLDRTGLRIVAAITPREYVTGVVAAELPPGPGTLRRDLAAAALRFLSGGPRHDGADVCDTTHCAWFVGRGPHLLWRPGEATPGSGATHATTPLDDLEWSWAVASATEAGPAHWTGHCGGAPLSPHALWGNGDRRITACPRHDSGSSRPWNRFWSEADVAGAFGVLADDLFVDWPDGVWTLEVRSGDGARGWRYDDAHRALAARLGWGALPSPATRISKTAGGWRSEGVGLGHRVGLCLGEGGGVINAATIR
ncbi:MAG: SpoIID/LytB domain-containing protein, partial [Thermoplasmata archaeon]|nr:SpoIID/LytB domain-containing protein [Thermoplasmata archaeon]